MAKQVYLEGDEDKCEDSNCQPIDIQWNWCNKGNYTIDDTTLSIIISVGLKLGQDYHMSKPFIKCKFDEYSSNSLIFCSPIKDRSLYKWFRRGWSFEEQNLMNICLIP